MDAVDLFVDGDADDIFVADVENFVNDPVDVDDDADDEFLCGASEGRYQDLMTNATEVSVEGSPLFADDDMRELPALYHQDLQGGNSKSKHPKEDEIVYEGCTGFSTFLPEVIDRARVNFAKFWNMPVEAVDERIITEKSPSLGIAGRSDPNLEIRDHGLIDSERRMREQQERSLSGHIVDDEGTEDQNVQIIQLIAALGNKDSGR